MDVMLEGASGALYWAIIFLWRHLIVLSRGSYLCDTKLIHRLRCPVPLSGPTGVQLFDEGRIADMELGGTDPCYRTLRRE